MAPSSKHTGRARGWSRRCSNGHPVLGPRHSVQDVMQPCRRCLRGDVDDASPLSNGHRCRRGAAVSVVYGAGSGGRRPQPRYFQSLVELNDSVEPRRGPANRLVLGARWWRRVAPVKDRAQGWVKLHRGNTHLLAHVGAATDRPESGRATTASVVISNRRGIAWCASG